MTLRQEEGGLLLHDGAGRGMCGVQVIHLGFPAAPLLVIINGHGKITLAREGHGD